MRVVLDTNVVISGLVTRGGPPARLVDLWAEGRLTVIVCPAILEEYLTVLLRPRFGVIGSLEHRHSLIRDLIDLPNTLLVQPDPTDRVDAVQVDPTDNRFLECALAAGATHLVSGDLHLLDLHRFKDITICAPRDFLARLE